MVTKGRMFKDLILAISRNSGDAREFLDDLNTSKDFNTDRFIKDIIRPIIYTHGLKEDKWREEYKKNRELYGDAERVVMDSIFSNDHLPAKQELIKNHSLWDEVNIDEVFESFKELGEYLHHLCFNEDILVSCNDTKYIRTKHKWIGDKKGNEINEKIVIFIKRQEFKIKGERTDLCINRPRLWKEARDSIEGEIFERPNFNIEMFNYEMGKTFYKDGCYNWKTKDFEYGNNNTRIFIDRKFNNKSKPEVREELYRRVLRPFFTIREEDHPENADREKTMKYCLFKLAQCFSGLGSNKNPNLLFGDRDGGKSLMNKLFMNSFGSYHGNFDLEILRKDNNPDTDRNNAKWVDYDKKRFAVSLESPDNSIVLDGSKIKKLCSNGDPIQYRHLRKETTTMVIKPHIWMFANDVCKISGNDVKKKIVELLLNTSFYDPDEVPESERYDTSYWVLRDSSVEEFVMRDDVAEEFVMILMEAHDDIQPVPDIIKREKEEVLVSPVKILKEHFELGTRDDWVPYESIKAVLGKDFDGHSNKVLRRLREAFGKEQVKPKANGSKNGCTGIKEKNSHLFE